MNRWIRWAAAVALPALVFAGCSDDDDTPAVDHEGLHMCCELGAYCHPPAGTLPDADREHCHNLGHENVPALCRAEYDSCMALCADNTEASEHSCEE